MITQIYLLVVVSLLWNIFIRSLFSNEITTIVRGAFVGLSSLRDL